MTDETINTYIENHEADDAERKLEDEAIVTLREVMLRLKARSNRCSVVSARDALPVVDSVRMYLLTIAKVPLLTAAEEVDLAMKIEAGAKAAAELEHAADEGVELPRREMRRLSRIEQMGCEAKWQFIEANLRLVVSVAKRYENKGMPLLDLIQEGNLGLIRAVEKFDYRKGFKFSTYATWWIRQAITRAIANYSSIVRIPVHMVETIIRLDRVQRRLAQELGREPKPEEIGREMGMSVERVLEIQKLAQKPESLERAIGDEDGAELEDFIEDVSAVQPDQAAIEADRRSMVATMLDGLPERERTVIILRFGLNDEPPHTLEQIGGKLGITRERVRQIECKALASLGSHHCAIRSRELL